MLLWPLSAGKVMFCTPTRPFKRETLRAVMVVPPFIGLSALGASAFPSFHWAGKFPAALAQEKQGETGRCVQPKAGAAEGRHYQLQRVKLCQTPEQCLSAVIGHGFAPWREMGTVNS